MNQFSIIDEKAEPISQKT